MDIHGEQLQKKRRNALDAGDYIGKGPDTQYRKNYFRPQKLSRTRVDTSNYTVITLERF